jgi:hypothetical protein
MGELLKQNILERHAHNATCTPSQFNPYRAGGSGTDDDDLLLEDEDDDEDDEARSRRTGMSLFAPPASATSTAQSDPRYQAPKSRKAKKLFNAAPAAPPVLVAPHKRKEMIRRHKCRAELFALLDAAREEEQGMVHMLEVSRSPPPGALNDAFRRDAMTLYLIESLWSSAGHSMDELRQRDSGHSYGICA